MGVLCYLISNNIYFFAINGCGSVVEIFSSVNLLVLWSLISFVGGGGLLAIVH